MTSAAGLAMGGMHPVVAIYSTFLNRAFDQIMMDVALHQLPVTMVLDRAGITGPDGASHNGMWDLSILGIVPGMRVAAPRDAARLREELGEALAVTTARPRCGSRKATWATTSRRVERLDGVDVLAVPANGLSADVLLVAVGPFAAMALSAAERLQKQGIGVTVVDPRWVLPVPEAFGDLATGTSWSSTWRTTACTAASARRYRRRCGAPDRHALPRRRRAAAIPGPRVAQRDAR